MGAAIELTETEMTAAFTEWERRYREEPEKFMHDVTRFTRTTPETYGEGATRTFLGYLQELRGEAGATSVDPTTPA